ncbi:DUF3592 domain-containing protein [Streptomyces sp. NPDC086549]|uniref:DUF3592 domain-containing protein n=1 Tax=Streptomyces sp. NPDC086549 TaxID=3365752 RepID=UPI003809E136
MNTGPGRLRRFRGAIACGAGALVMLVLTLGVFLPAAWQRVDVRGGTPASARFQDSGSGCFFGGCRVEFTVAGEPVTADLPVGTSTKEHHTGDSVDVLYAPGEPERVALADDAGRTEVALLLAPPGGLTLVMALAAVLRLPRDRRPEGPPQAV